MIVVHVLMYHSISDGPAPTCISPRIFSEQMATIEGEGYQVISLTDFASWHNGKLELPENVVVLTFDDGFEDFYDSAFPVLRERNWTATVFLPTKLVGGIENWDGQLKDSPRRLMNWAQIAELKEQGIEFGGHSLTHEDLTSLSSDELERQVRMPLEMIKQQIGDYANCFAPPYGRCNARVQGEIRKWCQASVGVRLDRATQQSDIYDVPRIEMHYFRNIKLWRSFLQQRAEVYFASRRLLRNVRNLL